VYRVEDELDRRLDLPVMHDDQHGTAVVLLAAVLSAARLLGRPLEDMTFGQVGLGAAGSAIARLAMTFPFRAVCAYDPDPVAADRLVALAPESIELTVGSSPGVFDRALAESDVVVLTTGQPGLLMPEQIRPGIVVFPLSNPLPEIRVEDALAAGAALANDGSIVNNVLAYPGLFRGALDAGASSITPAMKQAAARALADLTPEGVLLPDPLDPEVHRVVAAAVAAAAD
jgi:malate dehydrogenase (oxaloacetate-decarboxylating)